MMLSIDQVLNTCIWKSIHVIKLKLKRKTFYGDFASSFCTLKFWVGEFKRGRINLTDNDRLKRPKTAAVHVIPKKIYKIMLDSYPIKTKFWPRLIPVDGTWIYDYTPKTKMQSKQWTAKWKSTPKKKKTVLSTEKNIITGKSWI